MVRAVQYLPFFDASPRWSAHVISRQSERLRRLVDRADRPDLPMVRPLLHAPLAAYRTRWEKAQEDAIVAAASKCDVVHLIKVADLPLYRRLKALNGPRLVMEMNDGLWLPFFRPEWNDLDALLHMSDSVICENGHLADYARARNPHVIVVPDSPQLELFDAARDGVSRDPSRCVLGWIGSRETAGSLYRILEPLEALAARHPQLELRVVGANEAFVPRFEKLRVSFVPVYDQDRMVREALAMDIGVFPLFHNGDAMARGTLKAMIYMSAGAAVIAENVGENPKLIANGVNGVLAETTAGWLAGLERLVAEPEHRRQLAENGLATIRDRYSASCVFDQLLAAYDAAVAA
jgi:glycosyltransferase involved in cell wall biosynthesis